MNIAVQTNSWLADQFTLRPKAATQSRPDHQKLDAERQPDFDLGVDPTDDRPSFGINCDGVFITDPTRSQCGRFEVDPQECYGLTPQHLAQLNQLNQHLEAAT
ncbi:MAG: hypothetical protein Q7T63_14695, partial [Burkholderiaceae bacterium]|nr:hypothetical protein [Burkholderiaceae bacterium]